MNSSRLRSLVALAAVVGGTACVPTWIPFVHRSADERVTCTPPEQQRQIVIAPESLAGRYRLIVVSTAGPRIAQVTTGTMRLKRTDLLHRFPQKLDPNAPDVTPVQSPLYGSSNINLRPVGARGIVHPVKSKDPDEPGVQTLYYPAWRSLTLLVGAPNGPLGSGTSHGVWFDLWQADRTSMSGIWMDAPGNGTASSSGYFCAKRIGRF